MRELSIFGDFNVYGIPLSNNIRLLHRLTLTYVLIVQIKCNDNLPLELRLQNCVGNSNAYLLHKITV